MIILRQIYNMNSNKFKKIQHSIMQPTFKVDIKLRNC